MNINAGYKNSVFSTLFGNPEALRELYSAVSGVELSPDIPIDINTLSDILYMGQINDISFTIDNRLVVLIEHQSTVNRGMPLRLLMYIARVYEKIVDRKKLYQTNPGQIPVAEFFVLYNGTEQCPDYEELRLSDLYKDASGLLGVTIAPALELVVKVYNINKGRNEEILRKSKTLDGYGEFVYKVREYGKTQNREEAMRHAIQYCVDNGILRDFFEKHGSEVINMLLTAWDTEEAKAVWYEEGREEGREEALIAMAQKMKGRGRPIREISEDTGLSEEVIKSL